MGKIIQPDTDDPTDVSDPIPEGGAWFLKMMNNSRKWWMN